MVESVEWQSAWSQPTNQFTLAQYPPPPAGTTGDHAVGECQNKGVRMEVVLVQSCYAHPSHCTPSPERALWPQCHEDSVLWLEESDSDLGLGLPLSEHTLPLCK